MNDHLPQARVLIVDDDAQTARSIARVLSDVGWTPRIARSLEGAIEILTAEPIVAIVSDISMPGGSGLELLDTVKELEEDLAVVLVTGGADVATVMQAVNSGASGFLLKPVGKEMLVAVVAKAVAQTARSRSHRLAAKEQHERELNGANERASTEGLFFEAMDAVDVHFQPIVDWDRKAVLGYEALVRCSLEGLRNPLKLFELARKVGGTIELGRRIRSIALGRFLDQAMPGTDLYLNLAPEDFDDPTLYASNSPLGRHAERVVLEVSEQTPFDAATRQQLKRLRRIGFRVAVDDVGAGYAGLNRIAELEPDVIKLDMTLVRDVHATPIKQRLVSALAAVARESDVAIISEGVENEHECLALGVLGCNVVQGYHIARPSRDLTNPFELRVVATAVPTAAPTGSTTTSPGAVTGTRPKFPAGWSEPSSETGT